MTNSYRVRPIRPADVDDAVLLICAAGDYAGRPDRVAGSRKLLEMAASGELASIPSHYGVRGVVLVAEETGTGAVAGVVTAGGPGAWCPWNDKRLPPRGRRDLAAGIGEIYEIAVAPGHRRKGVGTTLLQAVLDSPEAKAWRMALWFFYGNDPVAAGFNHAVAPTLPAGMDLMFLEPGGVPVAVRRFTNDLRVCLAPLVEGVHLVKDPPTGRCAVEGVFTGAPWPIPESGLESLEIPAARRGSKGDRKREKKQRGRSRSSRPH